MKKSYLMTFLIVIILISGCGKKENLKEECCKECLNAFQNNPEVEDCSKLDLSKYCNDYFKENPKTVAQCNAGIVPSPGEKEEAAPASTQSSEDNAGWPCPSIEKCLKITNISLVCHNQEALRCKDWSICELQDNQEDIDSCLMVTGSALLDSIACEKIVDEDKKDSCNMLIGISGPS